MEKDTFLHAKCYDRRIDWDARLSREWPFFKKLFKDYGVKRILDCACGTGRHAVLFSRHGYSVRGTDRDEGMILLSRENAARASEKVIFTRASYAELSRALEGERFDAVICTGNSLGPLPDYHQLHIALANMASVIAEGGILVLHILNYARLIAQRVEYLPLKHTRENGKELFFLKWFRYAEPWIEVNFIDIEGQGENWSYQTHTGRLLPTLPDHLRADVEGLGFSLIGEYGDYSFTPFDRKNSRDYIIAARAGTREEDDSG